MHKSLMSEVIRQAYNASSESYARNTALLKAEEFILSYVEEEIRGKSILDVGVGAGRTVPYLRSLSNDYTGIDYSESMLRLCTATHPGTKLLLCDARNMDIFEDSHFDIVFCSWNMLDDVNHEDRGVVLREIHRVLKEGGLFIFSTHNLNFKVRSAFTFRGFVHDKDSLKSLKENAVRIKRYLAGIRNHLRNKKGEVHESEYSIINDPSHNYSLLTYYIKKENQVKQLERSGFFETQMIDERGALISMDQDCTDGWIYYICRKRANEI